MDARGVSRPPSSPQDAMGKGPEKARFSLRALFPPSKPPPCPTVPAVPWSSSTTASCSHPLCRGTSTAAPLPSSLCSIACLLPFQHGKTPGIIPHLPGPSHISFLDIVTHFMPTGPRARGGHSYPTPSCTTLHHACTSQPPKAALPALGLTAFPLAPPSPAMHILGSFGIFSGSSQPRAALPASRDSSEQEQSRRRACPLLPCAEMLQALLPIQPTLEVEKLK